MTEPASPTCFQVHARDNVATLLVDGEPGEVAVLGAAALPRIALKEPIPSGHKVALAGLSAGDPVIKYGVAIGLATATIAAGEWVHLHNCRSTYDQRSSTLDLESGAPTDTRYAS